MTVEERRALDERLFRLGFLVRGRRFHRHFDGCQVGLVNGARCSCAVIATGRALVRR